MGEHELLIEIIKRAVKDFKNVKNGQKVSSEFYSAEKYLFKGNEMFFYDLSFENICKELQIDPDMLREKILKMKRKKNVLV
jgi:hypothetical protein